MVTKTSPQGTEYEINGRQFIWHPEDDEGRRDTLPAVVIPLRIKMRTVLEFADKDLDTVSMNAMLRALLPESHAATIDEMDVNDFQDMFGTWQDEYTKLTGASLGESSGSGGSSQSTEPSSSTTSEPVSVSA